MPGEDLDHQHQQRQRAEDVPDVEVLRRVVLRHVLVEELGEREAVVDPGQQAPPGAGACRRGLHFSHSSAPGDAVRGSGTSFLRRCSILLSDRYMCGGTSQVVGRGLVLEDAAGHVEGRAVARAEEAARPVVGQRRLRARDELVGRRAAEVGADAHDDELLGLAASALRCARKAASARRGCASNCGSASSGSSLGSAASCSGVRRMTQTGLPRHSTVSSLARLQARRCRLRPGRRRHGRVRKARSLLTKGTARKPAPTAPAQPEAMIQVRLPASIFWSVMFVLKNLDETREVNPQF